jgi:hypothetical protein
VFKNNSFYLVDISPSRPRNIGERTFITYHIAPLFKYYETTFATMSFEWIESHARAPKIMKTSSNSGIIKLDAKGTRFSDNREVWHMEVAGPPWNSTSRHACGDSKKTIRTDIFNLVMLLRDHLDCKVELGTRLKVFTTQVIGV